MSRSNDRPAARRARLAQELRTLVAAAREEGGEATEGLVDWLRAHREGRDSLWALLRLAYPNGGHDDAERTVGAVIAQTVAPRLAGMTPGTVWQRERRAPE